jgi:hypothetical protein
MDGALLTRIGDVMTGSFNLQNCKAHANFHFQNGSINVAIVEDYQRCECSFNLKEFLTGLNSLHCTNETMVVSTHKDSMKLKLFKDHDHYYLEYMEHGCHRAHFAKIQLNNEQFEHLKIAVIKQL